MVLFKPSPHKEEIEQAISYGVPNARIAERFGVNISTVKRYAQKLKKGKAKGKTEEKPGAEPAIEEPQQLVTITTKRPPVVFFMGEEQIELEPGTIYDAYLLYKDMKAGAGLTDGFSTVLLDGVAFLWKVLATDPIIEKGEVKMGVNYGRSPRESPAETGPAGENGD